MIVVGCVAAVACSASDEPTKAQPKPERDAATAEADASDSSAAGPENDASDSAPGLDAGAGKIPASRADASLTVPEFCGSVAPTSCPQPSPHWKDVSAIFMNRCAGCHNGAGTEWPLNQYEHVADWYGEIRARILDCTMPPVEAMLEMPLEER
ncbi:MAG TPA: hypothetical protein VGP15_18670, partial [Burkholderiales bacterium]|nr:hypothetical protein [Burkholderiales bacterium]